MSWQIVISGHHDDPTVEQKAKELGQKFAEEAKAADIGMNYGYFSGGTMSGDLLSPSKE